MISFPCFCFGVVCLEAEMWKIDMVTYLAYKAYLTCKKVFGEDKNLAVGVLCSPLSPKTECQFAEFFSLRSLHLKVECDRINCNAAKLNLKRRHRTRTGPILGL